MRLLQPKYTNERRTEALHDLSFSLKACNALTGHKEVNLPVTFVTYVLETYGIERGYAIPLPKELQNEDPIIKCRYVLIQAEEKLNNELFDLKNKLDTVQQLLEDAKATPCQYMGEGDNK